MVDQITKEGKRLSEDNRERLSAVARGLLVEIIMAVNGGETLNAPIYKEANQEVLLSTVIKGELYTLIRTPLLKSEEKNLLSPRETEIARLVAKGHPNKVIAEILEISPWTVATHLRRIYTKLGVSSRAQMVAFIARCGLLLRVRTS